MTDDKAHHDPIETMLADLQNAERADVFSRTSVDPEALIADVKVTFSLGRVRRMVGLLAAAAMVALAFGLWSVAPQSATPRGAALTQSSDDPCDGNFIRCFSGPDPGVMASRCLVHDYDADGDIDLADFRDYQIRCNRPPSASP